MDTIKAGGRGFGDHDVAVVCVGALPFPLPVVGGEHMRRVVELVALAEMFRHRHAPVHGVAREHAKVDREILDLLLGEEHKLYRLRIRRHAHGLGTVPGKDS